MEIIVVAIALVVYAVVYAAFKIYEAAYYRGEKFQSIKERITGSKNATI